MHDARVYSRNLTASEIVALYNATKQSGGDVAGTLYAADLAGMWPLEDINTYYVRDMSGNGRDGYWGTLRGFSLTTADSLSGVYLGADVPSSIRNELGYSKIESSELLLQGDFPSGQTSWTSSGQSTFSNGYATVKSTDGSYQYIIYQPSYVKAGRRYKLEYTILANRAGVIASDVVNGFTLPSTVGKQTVYFTCYLAGAPEVDAALTIKRSGVTDIDITNISLIEVDEFPPDATDLTLDCKGNSLTYRGPPAKRAQPKGAPARRSMGRMIMRCRMSSLTQTLERQREGLCRCRGKWCRTSARGPGNDRIYLGEMQRSWVQELANSDMQPFTLAYQLQLVSTILP